GAGSRTRWGVLRHPWTWPGSGRVAVPSRPRSARHRARFPRAPGRRGSLDRARAPSSADPGAPDRSHRAGLLRRGAERPCRSHRGTPRKRQTSAGPRGSDPGERFVAAVRARRPPRARWRRLVVAVVALVALGAGAWLAWSRISTPAVRTVAARAATPAGGGVGSVLDASGYVTARRQATVSAKITGKVTEVLIEEGMHVSEGAVLARLDDMEARQQVTLARAQLAAARSQDGEIRAQLLQAERDYTRTQELFKRELVAEQSLDAAHAQRDTLRAKLVVTEEQIRVAGESLRMAEVQLDNTVIRAPFSGIVIAK